MNRNVHNPLRSRQNQCVCTEIQAKNIKITYSFKEFVLDAQKELDDKIFEGHKE